MFRLSKTYNVHDIETILIIITTSIIIDLNIMQMLSHLLKYVQATLNTLLHPGIGISRDQIIIVSIVILITWFQFCKDLMDCLPNANAHRPQVITLL